LLETPLGDDENAQLGDFIEDQKAILPIDVAIQSNMLVGLISSTKDTGNGAKHYPSRHFHHVRSRHPPHETEEL
jgi:hypothetical protein